MVIFHSYVSLPEGILNYPIVGAKDLGVSMFPIEWGAKETKSVPTIRLYIKSQILALVCNMDHDCNKFVGVWFIT